MESAKRKLWKFKLYITYVIKKTLQYNSEICTNNKWRTIISENNYFLSSTFSFNFGSVRIEPENPHLVGPRHKNFSNNVLLLLTQCRLLFHEQSFLFTHFNLGVWLFSRSLSWAPTLLSIKCYAPTWSCSPANLPIGRVSLSFSLFPWGSTQCPNTLGLR